MFRRVCSSLWSISNQAAKIGLSPTSVVRVKVPCANISLLSNIKRVDLNSSSITSPINYLKTDFLQPKLPNLEQSRTVIKFSWKKGTRKTVKAVVKRFYRLNCGNWIRTIAGRNTKVWRKSVRRRVRYTQHVFCNATQSRMLDTMVSKYWRKPKYFIESPYEPYEWRDEFHITKRKPWRPEGCDYE